MCVIDMPGDLPPNPFVGDGVFARAHDQYLLAQYMNYPDCFGVSAKKIGNSRGRLPKLTH